MSARNTDPVHGKYSTYTNQRCRCDECREAARVRMGSYRKARFATRVMVNGRLVAPGLPKGSHGKEGTYTNHGCRCPRCTEAWAEASLARRYKTTMKQWAQAAPRKDAL